ncbi:BatD family protein [Pedobacter africanus]|uniref:Oxygen tolerance n=1 Tax=Pedobacter africanus TaxID=151894 RepID=A0A1W2E169_9SPHI|nr:hypothetical protein [Pedobacter africanus]SMD02976.1 hypothetical protein SAMN04488524_4323 [Pedobacter africanus]
MKPYFSFRICLLLLLAGFILKGNAQDIKVTARLDHTVIAMGDQTRLKLSVQLPQKAYVDFPALSDTVSSKVQIVSLDKTDTLTDKGNPALRTITRQYTITSFEPGLHMVPAFVFRSAAGELSTQALPLEVKEVKVDTTKAIYDIKEPLAISYSFMDWLRDNWKWVLGVLLGILLIAGLLYHFIKKRKNRPVPVAVPVPALPLDKLVLDKLNRLKNKKLWEQGQVKAYHSELTDIIRDYLEKRYGIKALEQTSEEIFSGLRHLTIAEQDRNRLRQMLLLADLVKFAKENPLPSDNEQSMENAMNFVKNTKAQVSLTDDKKEEKENGAV